MPVKLRVMLVVIAAGLTAFTLWPAYSVGTFILVPILVVFLVTAVLLVELAYRTRARWPLYGMVGAVPGSLIGSVGLVRLARWFGEQDDDGIESMVVLSAGIAGAYVGALLGAAIGSIIGLIFDRPE